MHLKVFTPEQYAIFTAVAQRCGPAAAHEPGKPVVPGALPHGGVDVAQAADALLSLADDDARAGIGLALNTLERGVADAPRDRKRRMAAGPGAGVRRARDRRLPHGHGSQEERGRLENLRHHDLDNLFVIDGSVCPTSLTVNPQISI